jgi:hypothetical protein
MGPPKEKAGTENIPAGLQSRKILPATYSSIASPAIDIAAIIARRYRLPPVRARLICHLAGIGGVA